MSRFKRWLAGIAAVVVLAGGAIPMAGCGSAGYLAQSVQGHLSMLHQARPVPELLADLGTADSLRDRLALAQRIRDFAVAELRLPDNGSYRRYADLRRPVAVWNVVAAPELSLKLKTSCFPVVGCVGYRGYYDRAEADAEASVLRSQGYEVGVYGVPAYSTLGKLDWLGGDPLLNTFINYPEGELARLIFHELAHQVVYARDDTMFNESFATAVERIGIQRWLGSQAGERARIEYERLDQRRRDFQALTLRCRRELELLYSGDLDEAAKRERKAEIMAGLRAEYERIKAERWDGFKGYDAWFDRANNASLGVLAAYTEWVPAFERMFAAQGGDFTRFYDEVRRLAALPKEERKKALDVGLRP
jgi:predicted aminopeptidase